MRELGSLTITKVAVDEKMSNNCYLLTCKHTGEASSSTPPTRRTSCCPSSATPPLTHVITTHQHWDHHRALADVVEATGATTVAGIPDADAITTQTGVPIALEVKQGDTVPVGECTLEVISIAGHTPGSIALLYDDSGRRHPHLFTGDSLFPGGVGNTFGDDAAFAQLIDEVETKVFQRLPDDTWFYPGHGNDSTIGAERPSLAEWRSRGW